MLGGLLAEARPDQMRRCGFATWPWGSARRGRGIETVDDEQIAFGVVECREGCNALEVIERGKRVHLVIVDLVPGDVPAGAVGLDANRQVHRAEVVADGGKTCHQGQLGAADREDERVVVDGNGTPQRIAISRPLGYGLDASAAEAMKRWRFAPGMKGGSAVATGVVLEQQFTLINPPR